MGHGWMGDNAHVEMGIWEESLDHCFLYFFLQSMSIKSGFLPDPRKNENPQQRAQETAKTVWRDAQTFWPESNLKHTRNARKRNLLNNGDGSVHTARRQHQRICAQICALASSVDWASALFRFSQKSISKISQR